MTFLGDPLTGAPADLREACRRIAGTLPPSAVLEVWSPALGEPGWLVVVEWAEGQTVAELQAELGILPDVGSECSPTRLELRSDGWLVQLDRHLPPCSALETLRAVVTSHRCATVDTSGPPLSLPEPGSEGEDFRRAAELLAALSADPADLWGSVMETYCRFGHFDGLLATDSLLSA